MPEIVLPFSLVDFPSSHVVIHSYSMFHLVDEGALVLIATPVEVTSLDQGRCPQGLPLETIPIWVMN